MNMVMYWMDVMDTQKKRRAEARFPETAALYGRAEMLARSEVEMAEAEEKARAKR
jgi:hypothetical protein